MKELVVISGKGGTGKTSVAGGFAVLASRNGRSVVADCDVDAADMHLILAPNVRETHEFTASELAVVDPDKCTGCTKCEEMCRFGAVSFEKCIAVIDPIACEGCGVCAEFCRPGAITMQPRVSGQWFVSTTRAGAMVHARLGIAEANSGKLVSQIRKRARQIAEDENCDYLIVDGSPGLGCPVIASVTGADALLVVTEPTQSGLHDMERVLELARHFEIPQHVCVNKADINPEVAGEIEYKAAESGAAVTPRIPYDPDVTRAQVAQQTIVELSDGPAASAIGRMWRQISQTLQSD